MVPFLIVIVLLGGVFIYHVELLIAFWGTLLFIQHLHFLLWIKAHPLLTITYAAAYFLVGGVWSIVKWWFKETEKLRTVREAYDQNEYDEQRKTWSAYRDSKKTKVSNHYEDFCVWIAFWPFSAVWTFLDDPVRRLVRRIYHELQAVYQRITDYVWSRA